jgi:hypothetical protein
MFASSQVQKDGAWVVAELETSAKSGKILNLTQ